MTCALVKFKEMRVSLDDRGVGLALRAVRAAVGAVCDGVGGRGACFVCLVGGLVWWCRSGLLSSLRLTTLSHSSKYGLNANVA